MRRWHLAAPARTCTSFVDGHAGGTDLISGFKVGTDQIGLFGYDLGTVQQSSAGGNTMLDLSDGTKITLLGVTQLAGNSIV